MTIVPGDAAALRSDLPSKRSWIVPVVIAALLLIAAGVLGTVAARAAIRGAYLDTPGTASVDAHAGSYLLYAQDGSSTSFGPFTGSESYDPDVDLSTVAVTQDGQRLPVTPYDSSVTQTLAKGGQDYVAVGRVQVPRAGPVTLSVANPEGRLALAPPVSHVFKALVPALVVGALGLVAFVVFVVMIIRYQKRRRPPPWSRPPPGPDPYAGYPYAGYPPPGWGPPGYGPPGWGRPPS